MVTVWIHNPVSNRLYAAKRSLASGGQAIVFDGLADGAPVAIKVIRESSNFLRDHQVWDAEKNAYQRCSGHPHIVAIIDHFISSTNNLVIVMERAEGTAQQLIERGIKYSPQQVCRIGVQLASALEHVHRAGVIHRDLTLKNVLQFPGDLFKLGDFGISRADLMPWELARTLVAAPGYLPPELLRGGSFTRQSDIYQLGIVLLSLLLGRQVAPRGNVNQAILAAEPRLTAMQAVEAHGRTAEIIQWMLPRTPEKRYQSAEAVRLAFQAEYDRLNALGLQRPAPAKPMSPQALERRGIGALPAIAGFSANPLPQAIARNGIDPLPKLPEGMELSAQSRLRAGIGLAALQRMPERNGLLGGLPSLQVLARNPLPVQPPLSALAAKGIGLERQPPLVGIGLNKVPQIPRLPLSALASKGIGLEASPPFGFGLGLDQAPQLPPPPANEQVGGLLALSSLAAFAGGKPALGGLFALGSLASFAAGKQDKSSSS